MAIPQPTELIYFNDTYLLTTEATIVAVQSAPPALLVQLDRTVFYPSGGGQPADRGTLTASGTAFQVTDVRKGADGVVWHTLAAEPGAVQAGAAASLAVDGTARLLHARIHSAGHLLDVAMARCGYGPGVMSPSKGSHTPADAWVEYAGKVEPAEQAALLERLNAEVTAAVAAGGSVAARLMAYEEAVRECGGLPPYIPPGSTPRVVTLLPGTQGCPCGGTQVADVAEVGGMRVTGLRVKKGLTKVSYVIEGMPSFA